MCLFIQAEDDPNPRSLLHLHESIALLNIQVICKSFLTLFISYIVSMDSTFTLRFMSCFPVM